MILAFSKYIILSCFKSKIITINYWKISILDKSSKLIQEIKTAVFTVLNFPINNVDQLLPKWQPAFQLTLCHHKQL